MYRTKYPHPVALLYPKTTAGKFEVNLVKEIEFKVNWDGFREDANSLVSVKYLFKLVAVISKITMNTSVDWRSSLRITTLFWLESCVATLKTLSCKLLPALLSSLSIYFAFYWSNLFARMFELNQTRIEPFSYSLCSTITKWYESVGATAPATTKSY